MGFGKFFRNRKNLFKVFIGFLILVLLVGGFLIFYEKFRPEAASLITGELAPGWPKEFGAGKTVPAVSDINNDGNNEIILVSDYMGLNIIDKNGVSLSGFPIILQPGLSSKNGKNSSPVVADLDQDGKLEVILVFNYRDNNLHNINKLIVIQADGKYKSGWPVIVAKNESITNSVPTVADVDVDGKMEIFVKSTIGKIYGYRNNGTSLAGWPVQMDFLNDQTQNEYIDSPVVLDDINNDNKPEVLAGFSTGANGNNSVFAYSYDGKKLTGWPQIIETRPESGTVVQVATADINADGKNEIIGRTSNNYYPYPPHSTIIAWDSNGNRLWINYSNDSPSDMMTFGYGGVSFADIDGDRALDVIMPTTAYIFIYSGKTGNKIIQFSNTNKFFNNNEVSLADFNNDNILEIISVLQDGNIGIFSLDGILLWKTSLSHRTFSSAILGDFDNDGKLEIIANAWNPFDTVELKGWTYIYKFNQSSPANIMTWSQFRRNNKHSGYFEPFKDVNINDTFYQQISKIYQKGITVGNICQGSSIPVSERCYNPNDNTTRQEMAGFITRAANLPLYFGIEQPFRDVPTNTPFYREIMTAYKAGIISGYPDGTYHPTENVTRAQTAVFLVRAKKLTPYDKPTPSFSDVPRSYWAYQYIEALYKAGFTSGCQQNPLKYCPESLVPRKEMAVFLAKTFLGMK